MVHFVKQGVYVHAAAGDKLLGEEAGGFSNGWLLD